MATGGSGGRVWQSPEGRREKRDLPTDLSPFIETGLSPVSAWDSCSQDYVAFKASQPPSDYRNIPEHVIKSSENSHWPEHY